MKLTRIESTPGGGSRFEDIEVSDAPGGPWPAMPYDTGSLVMHFPSAHIRVSVMPEGTFNDWHPTPHAPNLCVVLCGTLEDEATDGTKRVFPPGAAVISDNLTGRGHTTRVVQGPVYLLTAELPRGYELKRK